MLNICCDKYEKCWALLTTRHTCQCC